MNIRNQKILDKFCDQMMPIIRFSSQDLKTKIIGYKKILTHEDIPHNNIYP